MWGVHKIVCLRASVNKGLSPILIESFQNITPVERPIVEDQEISDPNWLAGFIEGEGCFYVGIKKSKAYKTGGIATQVQLNFSLVQHSRDTYLINSLIQFLNCGKLHVYPNHVTFSVSKLSDFEEKIMPFLQKYLALPITRG